MSLSPKRLEKVKDIGGDGTASMWKYVIPYDNWYVEDCKRYGKQERSPAFEVGKAGFKILAQQVHEDIGLYVECTGPLNSNHPWEGQEVAAHIKLETIPVSDPPSDDQVNVIVNHIFTSKAKSIGFSTQITKEEIPTLLRPTSFQDGFPTGIDVRVTIKYITAPLVSRNIARKQCFVGLRNQGATCYVNSLIQVLYHLGAFRELTYKLAVELSKEGGGVKIDRKKEIVMELANLFYEMQTFKKNDGARSVPTTQLTDAFGWEGSEVTLEQQDVQELARILIDAIDIKTTSTPLQNSIKTLLAGQVHHFIKCTNVDFCSSTLEPFLDIQLCVRGCKNVNESFKKQLCSEYLKGDNAYHAVDPARNIDSFEEAKKGMEYREFPPILCLHLRRCEFDYVIGENKMVNDEFEFSTTLDLSPFYRSEEKRRRASDKDDLKYELFSVLAHSGNGVGGHYFTYARPYLGTPTSSHRNQWFRFDDSCVTPVSEPTATTELFGGTSGDTFWLSDPTTGISTVAYMLTYVRTSQMSKIVPAEVNITKELHCVFESRNRAHREALTKKLEEREQFEFHITSEDVMCDYDVETGYLHDDLISPVWKSLAPLRLSMHTRYDEFEVEVRTHFSISNSIPIRLWIWLERNNETVRPFSPLRTLNTAVGPKCVRPEGKTPLSDIFPTGSRDGPHKVLLHIDQGNDMDQNTVGIFIKHFDPIINKITYAGVITISVFETLSELSSRILTAKDLPRYRAKVHLWEERRAALIQPLSSPTSTLEQCGLGTGDIVIYTLEMDLVRRVSTPPSPVDAFRNLLTRRKVVLSHSPSEGQKQRDPVELSMRSTDRYPHVLDLVSETLRVSSRHIRFTIFGRSISPPCDHLTLSQMLSPDDKLTYQIMKVAVQSLLSKVEIPISYVTMKGVQKQELVFLKKDATVSAALVAISKAANSEDLVKKTAPLPTIVSPKKLQLFQIVNHRINSLLLPSHKVRRWAGPEVTFQAAQDVMCGAGEDSTVVSVCNCERQWSNSHILEVFGIPFLFVISSTLTADDFITAVAEQLGITKEARIRAWKLLLIHLDGPREAPLGTIPLSAGVPMLDSISGILAEYPNIACTPLDVRFQKAPITLMIGIERRNDSRKTLGEKGVEIKD